MEVDTLVLEYHHVRKLLEKGIDVRKLKKVPLETLIKILGRDTVEKVRCLTSKEIEKLYGQGIIYQ